VFRVRITELSADYLPEYAEVIRKSFATVAKDFGFTRENCPRHTSFVTDERFTEKFRQKGYHPYGLFDGNKLIGFVSLADLGGGVYDMCDVSVLPQYRRLGYGKKLLEFCKEKVKSFGGEKIKIGIIEENAVLKEWYAANGFVHTGTEKYEMFTAGFMEWRL